MWLSHRCRLLHGIEKLRLQGVMAAEVAQRHSDAMCSNLAGNAFCGPAFLAAFMAWLCGMAQRLERRLQLQQQQEQQQQNQQQKQQQPKEQQQQGHRGPGGPPSSLSSGDDDDDFLGMLREVCGGDGGEGV